MSDTISPSHTPLAADDELRAEVDSLNHRAYALRITNTSEALTLAEHALGLARRIRYVRGEAYALRARGACRSLLYQADGAIADLKSAVALFASSGDERGRAVALARIGSTYSRKGDLPEALPWLFSALDVQRAIGDRAEEAYTLVALGTVYSGVGDYARSLELCHQANVIFEAEQDSIGLSFTSNNAGTLHLSLGDYEEARKCYERTLALKRQIGDRPGEAIALLNLGIALAALRQPHRALSLFRSGLELARDTGERACEAEVLASLADLYDQLGAGDEARDYYRTSLDVASAHGLYDTEAATRIHLGELLTKQGSVDEAVEHLVAALDLARRVGSLPHTYAAHKAFAAVYEVRGETDEALCHYKTYHQIKEEVWSTDSDRRIRAQLVRVQVEQSRREAELLRERNEALAAANEEKVRLVAELDRLTREDALTGIANRRALDAQLALEWERARRFQRDLTVAMVDVDHFKQVNDRHGHAAGDEVLRRIAALLGEQTRRVDFVARCGGEEFVLLLVETPLEGALAKCEQLRAAVEEYDWEAVAPGLRVTVSFGVSGDPAPSPDALLAAADARLYAAKHAGRNRVHG
ncbi:MAG TPA: tetratricopeptide repeat-containing diguanylate cyclase [Longimicrobium sp.]|nr:tetratricopeptide repeat-containing diguanylate cyclase [Longimicrobium sp.]